MQTQYEYIALFIESEALYRQAAPLRSNPLPRQIQHPHITFAFRPAAVDESLFGSKATVTVTGYGNDGQNEGLLVTPVIDREPLQKLAAAIEVPHITLALAPGAKAVNTRDLVFSPVAPFTLEGTFGGMLRAEGTVVLQAPPAAQEC